MSAIPLQGQFNDNAQDRARSLGFLFAIFGIGLLLIYFTDIRNASVLWTTDEMYQHGWFIFPISALLVLWRRDEIAKAERKPEWIGVALLPLGLAAGCLSHKHIQSNQ